MARLPRGEERRGEAATRRSGGDEKKQKDERVREAKGIFLFVCLVSVRVRMCVCSS